MSPSEPAWLEEAIRKYRAKLDHVRLRGVYSKLIPQITDATAVAQAQNHRIQMRVKNILDQEGVLSDLHPYYYDYGLALDRSQREFEYMVDRIREHTILRQRWETRGLDPAILDKIDDILIFAMS